MPTTAPMKVPEFHYKARASGVQTIITDPKVLKTITVVIDGKTKKPKKPQSMIDEELEELSAGAKTDLVEWYKSQLYGVRKFISSKAMDKGTLGEDSAIEYYNSVNGTNWIKNEEHFENDYITGTPDVILDDEIIDIKMSYDCFSFPLFSKELKEQVYITQLQSYMWLTGKRKARVVKILMDTPDDLCPYGADPKDFKFNHLPSELRIKEFVVEWDMEKIQLIIKKVEKARLFVGNLRY